MRRTAIKRSILVLTVASIAAGLFGTTVAVARDPDSGGRQLRPGARPALETANARRESVRRVNVRDLPAATGLESPFTPDLMGPGGKATRSPRAVENGLIPPAEYTETLNAAATEAVSFDGIGDTGYEPPDPFIAVGPEHVMQAVNTTLRLSDRSGNDLASVDMFDFFLLGESYVPGEVAYFDPRVIYDSLHGRWIATEASFDCFGGGGSSGTGFLDIAVSDSADAQGFWTLYYVPFDDTLPDYPGIGTSTDKVVVSANLFDLEPSVSPLGCAPDTYLGTDMEVFAWSELMGTGDVYYDSLYSANFAGGSYPDNFFTWRPALQAPAQVATVFAVAEQYNENVGYARITGSPAGGGVTSITTSDISVSSTIAPFDQPSQPEQPGSPATIANAVDGRPTDAVWQNGKLAFVSTYPCDPAGGDVGEDRDCVRVAELGALEGQAPTYSQDFLIGEPDTDHFFGGVGYAGNGDLHVVWTRSSENAGQYPSSYAAHQLVTDAANALSAPQLLKAGTGTYPGTRWGDYVGVAQDPQVPNAVWQGNQYSAGVSGWATHVSQLQTGGSSYAPITPVRILDTRPAPYNVQLTGKFVANVPRTFQVAGYVGSIPADAIAVTGNVAVVGQSAAGYVAITPSATSTPPSATLNFPLSDVRANNFTIPLDASGRLAAVYKAGTGKSTNLVIDITGYFVAGDEGATYNPADAPVRVMDTRPAPYHIGPLGIFSANVPQTLPVAGELGIPPTATAITANLTVVGQTKAGYISVTPDPPVGTPPSSTMNFPLGDIRGNGLTADLNAAGDLSITYTAVAGGTVHVILDVTGWYEDGPSGLLFYPLTPGRMVDTRAGMVNSQLVGAFSANVPRTYTATGHWGVPAGAGAVAGNLSIVGQTAAGYVAITPEPTASPPTATINFPLGDIRGNGVTVPLNGTGQLSQVYKAGAGRTTHFILDVTGYFR